MSKRKKKTINSMMIYSTIFQKIKIMLRKQIYAWFRFLIIHSFFILIIF